MKPGTHGSTFGGNPLAMSAGNAVMDVMFKKGFFSNVTKNGNYFLKGLHKLKEKYPKIIKEVRGRNLKFSTNVDDSIRKADMVFISVNTPIKEKGIGAGETSDLRWVESCARKIRDIAEGHTIVVEKSTLPVKTAQTIKDILFSSKYHENQEKSFSVLSNP